MSRIRIKMGDFEVEYEGEQEFIENGLLGFIQETLDKFGLEDIQDIAPIENSSSDVQVAAVAAEPAMAMMSSSSYSDWTTDTFANALGIDSGSDLVLAAAAKLTYVDNKTSFSRQELLDAMKEAEMFYNDNHRSNLSKYITTLVNNGTFRKVRSGFVLHPEQKNRIEAQLD